MADNEIKQRWFYPNPGWLIFGLLVVEGVLWLSGRYRWLWFSERKGWTVLIAVATVSLAMLIMLLWFALALLLRWRFQFSIQSLLVLVVAVALPFSWLAVEMKKAMEQKAAVAAIEKLGGGVTYAEPEPLPGQTSPELLRRLLGTDFFDNAFQLVLDDDSQMVVLSQLPGTETLMLYNDRITDTGLQHLNGLNDLTSLVVANTHVTDEGLAYVAGLPRLEFLGFNSQFAGILPAKKPPAGRTRITDIGLQQISGLTKLQGLDLGGTQVTDAGLRSLAGLKQLESLSLEQTKVTDMGLEHLRGLANLQDLNLSDTGVSDEGVKKLQQALPNCKIER